VIGAVIVSVAVLIGLFFLGWWVKEFATNRNAEILQDSYGRQNALVEQILNDISEAEGDIPANQRIAIVDVICDAEAKLTGSIELPIRAQTFINKECNQ
jgi:hypothetical protein